jgi:6-phosphogluconolactonase (cycloisomerase 2 family)/fibronectin type 3 domain-containing protein
MAAVLYWQTVEKIGVTPGQPGSGQNGFFRPVFTNGNGPKAPGYPITGVALTSGGSNSVSWSSGGCTSGSTGKVIRTYRANVLGALPRDAGGNILVDSTDGVTFEVRLPSTSSTTPITLGATLVLIYRILSPSVPLNSIVIYDGDFSASSSSLTMMQTVQGFYDAATNPVSRLTHIVGNGKIKKFETVSLNGQALPSPYPNGEPPFPGYYGMWDNTTWTFDPNKTYVNLLNPVGEDSALATTQVVPANSQQGCVSWGAVIVSTTVKNSDNDGLLDAWKKTPPGYPNPGYCDAAVNEGVCTPGSSSWVDLPGAVHGQKDVFIQLDYMCSSNIDGTSGCNGNYSFDPHPSGAVDMMTSAFSAKGIHVHVTPSGTVHAIPETTCTDNLNTSPHALCAFPTQPGVVAWKGGFDFFKNQLIDPDDPTNLNDCTTSPPAADCTPRFQPGARFSKHYVLFAHAVGQPKWKFQGGTLMSVMQSGNTVTFTTSTPIGTLNSIGTGVQGNPIPDPSCLNGRVTVIGAATNPNLDGTYCIKDPTHPLDTSFKIIVGGSSTSASYTLSSDPNLAVAPGFTSTASGVSDVGGADSLITLGLWGNPASPTSDGQKKPVLAGTFMHELGHALGLTHGGFDFDTPGSFVPTILPNCNPNYQSVMSYSVQVDLLSPLNGGPNVPDYSGQALTTLTKGTAGSPGVLSGTQYLSTNWYVPWPVAFDSNGKPIGSSAKLLCDGRLITNGATMSRVTAPTGSLFWTAGQDINFDGNTTESLRGYSDWDNIDFRQTDATGCCSVLNGAGGQFNGGGGQFNGGGGQFNGGGGQFNGGGGQFNGGGGQFNGGGGQFNGGGEIDTAIVNSITRPPQSLTASEGVSPRTITLNWTAPTFGQIGAYKVYRSAHGGPFTVIATISGNPPATTFTDNVTCDTGGYRYFVTAVLANTNPAQESVPSNTVSIGSDGLLTGCYVVSNFSSPASAVQGSSVQVSWTLTDDFNIVGNAVTNTAANTLVAIGPLPNNCTTTGRTTILADGVPTSGMDTFTNVANNFTFTWNNTDAFCAGSYSFELDLDHVNGSPAQVQPDATQLQLGIDVTDTDSTPHITTTTLPSAVVGIPYMNTVVEDGGTIGATAFSWTIVPNSVMPGGGSTVPGISFQANAVGVTNGTLSGTPTTPGDYTFMVKVTDSVGNIGTQTLMLHVAIPGGLVYVANCTGTCTALNTGNVSGYVVDATSGALIAVNGSPFAAGGSPFWVTVDPAARFAYVANSGDGTVSGYSINVITGALTTVPGPPFASGGAPSSVAVDPTGRFAYVANRNDGTISAFTINPANGALTAIGSPVATGSQDFTVTVDSAGLFAYVTNLTGNNISAYVIDRTTGALTAVASSPFQTGTSPYVMATDPAAPFAYVANNLDNTISAYTIDTTTGALNSISGSPFATGAGTNNPRSVTVDPLGQFLYTANQNGGANQTGTVSAFSINATTGALSAVTGSPFAVGSQPVSVAVDTTGQFAYVANSSSNNISAYAINRTTGALAPAPGSPFAAGTFPASVAATTYACAAFPAGTVPFTTIFSIATDSAGDTFVVGGPNGGIAAALQNVPLPSVSNERFCNPVMLETNYTVPAYVPTAAERTGDYSAYAGLVLLDPQNNTQFPNNMIPPNRLNSVFAWRIPPHSSNLTRLSCSLEPTLRSMVSKVTSIQFANDTAGPVNVYWINYQGQRVFYRGGPYSALAAGDHYVQGTFITHPWIITDVATNTCLGIWLPTESAGTAVITGSVQPPLPPPAPTNLNAAVQPSGPGAESVVLTWNASNGAAGYNVYRATASQGPYTKLTSVPTTNLTFTDGTVQNGTTYYYATTAVDASGHEGAYSNLAPAMVPVPPQPPTTLTATVQGGSVVLNWNASTSTVSGYNVYRSMVSGSGYVKLNTALVTGLTYPDSTGVSGTNYYYVTTAVDGSGNESPYSNEASATAP